MNTRILLSKIDRRRVITLMDDSTVVITPEEITVGDKETKITLRLPSTAIQLYIDALMFALTNQRTEPREQYALAKHIAAFLASPGFRAKTRSNHINIVVDGGEYDVYGTLTWEHKTRDFTLSYPSGSTDPTMLADALAILYRNSGKDYNANMAVEYLFISIVRERLIDRHPHSVAVAPRR